jgi:hypothetical protein
VLRHELSHAARPVRRPRFLVPGRHGGDRDEQVAHRSEARLGPELQRALDPGPVVSPDIARGLPIAGPGAAPAVSETLARLAVASRATHGAGPGGAPDDAGRAAATAAPTVVARRSGPTPTDVRPTTGGTTGGTGDVSGSTAPGTGSPAPGDAVSATGQAAGEAAASRPDMDEIIEAIGDRLLREIERRGGRWSETF